MIAIGDVASTYSMQRARVSDDQNVIHHYFRLLLDYRDIWINYTLMNETYCAFGMRPNYFVVVLLRSWQIKRVARSTACNYECCVFVTLFFG